MAIGSFKINNIQHIGPVIEIVIFPPAPVVEYLLSKNMSVHNKTVMALVDTGASSSCIDADIAVEMELITRI